MFDGKVRGNRAVSSGGKKRESDKGAFLENTRKQREDRAAERRRLLAIVKLQSFVRRCLVRNAVIRKLTLEMDKKVSDINKIKTAFSLRASKFNVPLDVLSQIFRTFLFVFGNDGTLLATAADGSGLGRITAVLHLFLDSLQIKSAGSFNPFLKAADGLAASNITNSHRPWEYQVSELTRVSVALIGTFFHFEGTNSDHTTTVMTNDALYQAAEVSVQVLHSILQYQAKSDSTGAVDPRADSAEVMKANENSNSSLCCIARHISRSCTKILRLCISKVEGMEAKDSKRVRSNNYISISRRASSLLLAFVQQSVQNVEIPQAIFQISRDRNVSSLEGILVFTHTLSKLSSLLYILLLIKVEVLYLNFH